MKFVQAQFSLKYEPQIKIRRFANEIEDFLQDHYGPPQTMPVPDEFAPEAPRIILYSKNGHSQISFSQISVDFTVKFDNDFINDFEKTKEYINERVLLIIGLLNHICITEYLFCGVSYVIHLDINEQNPIDYIKNYLGGDISSDHLYEASQSLAYVKNDKYFINQLIGTYKQFQGRQGIIPEIFEVSSGTVVASGVSLTLDINNRYQYVYQNVKNPINDCSKELNCIFSILLDCIKKWE